MTPPAGSGTIFYQTPFQNLPRRYSRAVLGWPDEAVVLIYVGRLSPEKNLTFLLRTFFGVAAARLRTRRRMADEASESARQYDHAR